MRTRVIVAIAITLALVTDASAQGTGLGNVNPFTPQFNRDPLTGKLVPTQPFTGEPNHLNNPYPTQPWNQLGVGRVDYGQVVQYIAVPPQQAVITLYVPNGFPPQKRDEPVEIPGYYIAETTTGNWYPERLGLQQPNVGVYQRVKLPPALRRKQ